MFNDKMETEAIPERVYQLCKIIADGPITEDQLQERIEPKNISSAKSVYFHKYKRAAEELGLIKTNDNKYCIAVEKEHFDTIHDMRKYINCNIDRFSDSKFYKTTRAFYTMGDKVLQGETPLNKFLKPISDITGEDVDDVDIRAWRFWIDYLGFGVLYGTNRMNVIPNPYVFLNDLIENSDLEKGKQYSINEFLEHLSPEINIIFGFEDDNVFNYGLSNGIKMLIQNEKIMINHIMDNEMIYHLYKYESNVDKVSDIIIL